MNNINQSLVEAAQYILESHQYNMLLEGRIDFLKKNHPTIDTSHDSTATKHDSGAIIDHLATGDPTRNKSHLQWILNQYNKKQLKQDDMPHVHGVLSGFEKHKHQIDKRDVNQYKDIDDIKNTIDPHIGTPTTQKEIDADTVAKGRTLVHADADGTTVYKLEPNEHGKEASKLIYGGGHELGGTHTSWCTAARSDNNKFNEYSSKDDVTKQLHVIHLPNMKLYQAHPDSEELMDADNESITSRHPDASAISKSLKHVPGSLGIRQALGAQLDKDDISKAMESTNIYHREIAASHPLAGKDILDKAINDAEPRVRRSTVLNPNLTKEHMDKLANDPDSMTRSSFVNMNAKSTLEHFKTALHKDDKGSWFNTPMELIRGSTKITPDHINIALDHKDPDVRNVAAAHKNASESNLMKALGDPDTFVRNKAAAHKNATYDVKMKALGDLNERVRYNAISNNPHPDHIEHALKDKHTAITMRAQTMKDRLVAGMDESVEMKPSEEDMLHAIDTYKTYGNELNRHYRDKKQGAVVVNDDTDYPFEFDLTHFDYAFDQYKEPTAEDMVLYRGMNKKFNVPPVHQEDAYTSLSKNKEVAKKYAGKGGKVFNVHVPKGTHVLDLGKHAVDMEDEIVLPRDTSFNTEGTNMHVNDQYVTFNKPMVK